MIQDLYKKRHRQIMNPCRMASNKMVGLAHTRSLKEKKVSFLINEEQ